jgi:hypothetical protein
MHTLVFFSGGNGGSGGSSRNYLKAQLIGILRVAPGTQSTNGGNGGKMGVCPHLPPVKKTDRGQTSKPQLALNLQVLGVAPVAPVAPAKKHHSREYSGDCEAFVRALTQGISRFWQQLKRHFAQGSEDRHYIYIYRRPECQA